MSPPRVRILVLSSHVPPYLALYEAQRRTWDSVAVPGVETQYYFCDNWTQTYTHFGPALDEALADPSWTHLFRTNSSSYVCKRQLLAYCAGLPHTGCYCGGIGHFRGVNYCSGSGSILSRDAVRVLREALRQPPVLPGETEPLPGYCEDVFIGFALGQAGIAPRHGLRCDYWSGERHGPLPDLYHYRCAGTREGQRLDFEAFDLIHAFKMQFTGEGKTP